MTKPQIVVFAYGIFDIVMGLIGTLRSPNHEIMSLVGGGGAGLIVLGLGVLTNTKPRIGFIGAAVIGLMMAAMFASKTFAGVLYPAGLIFIVSLAFTIYLVGSHFAAMSKSKRVA